MITAQNRKTLPLLLSIFIALVLRVTGVSAAEHAEAAKAPAHEAASTTHEPAASGDAHASAAGAKEPSVKSDPEPVSGHASVPADVVSAAQAVAMLKEGNTRFAADKPQTTNTDARRRTETAKGQKPFVTLVSCSDSRVPAELIFDRGIGELFVVRVAGNVCGDDELGSIEYAVDHLHTPLVLIMGHTKCGAVTAAASGAEMPGHIATLVKRIDPAVELARKSHPELAGEAIVPAAIVANVYRGIEQMLTESEIIREHAKTGKVRIEAAIYDIAEGKVEWLGPHPRQSELLLAAATHSKSSKADDAVAVNHKAPTAPAVAHAQDAHDGKEATSAMTDALIESTRKEQVLASHPQAPSVQAKAVTTHPAAMEPPVQPAPHSLPGLLERCMAEELYRLGVRHLDAGEYAEAASRFQAAAGIDPSMLAARNDLAGVYCMQQKYNEALELYMAILEVDGQYRFAMRGAALCHASMRHYDQARAMLNRLLNLDRRDGRTWLELGDVCFLDNDADAARQFWTNASQVDKSATDVVKQANLRLAVYPAAATGPKVQSAK